MYKKEKNFDKKNLNKVIKFIIEKYENLKWHDWQILIK